MSSKNLPGVSGIVGLAVLALLVVALVAAQARANLPGDAALSGAFEVSANVSALPVSAQLQRLETLPIILNTVITLLADVSADDPATVDSRGRHHRRVCRLKHNNN